MINEALIKEFDNCLKKYCSYIYDYYQNSLPEEEIDMHMNKMGILNDDYKTLYKWKNGLDLGASRSFPKEFRISDFGNIVSLDDALHQFTEIRKSGTELEWPASQVVMFDNLIGERLLLETDKNSPYNNFVFCYHSYGSDACQSISYYDSIEKMLITLIEQFEQKALWFDDSKGFLEIDFDKLFEIGKIINHKSEYWTLL